MPAMKSPIMRSCLDWLLEFLPVGGEERWVGAIDGSEIRHDAFRFLPYDDQLRQSVQPRVKQALELSLLGLKVNGKAGERPPGRTHVPNCFNARFADFGAASP